MTLIVEDGLARDFPNSYAGLECADDYCVPRGLWPATAIHVDEDGLEEADSAIIAQKEACLVRAFDWLNTLEWKGERLDWEQAAAWPRKNVPVPGNEAEFIGEDVIPQVLVKAQCELAGLIYGGNDPLKPLERGGKYTQKSDSKTETVDVLSESESHSVAYADTAPVDSFFPAVIGYLRPFLLKIPGEGRTSAIVESGRG